MALVVPARDALELLRQHEPVGGDGVVVSRGPLLTTRAHVCAKPVLDPVDRDRCLKALTPQVSSSQPRLVPFVGRLLRGQWLLLFFEGKLVCGVGLI